MNPTDNSYQINILNIITVSFYRYVLLVFYVISSIGNLLSFAIFLKKSWRKNVCVFYFKFCLIVNTLYINSGTLGLILGNGYEIRAHNSNVILCKLYFYTSFLCATLSPTIHILASIDRLLISSQNVDTRLYSSKRLAYFLISISTAFWIIFNIHALVKIDIHEISPSIFVCSYDLPKSYLEFVSYSLGVINVVFCISMIILCVIAFKNVRRIRSQPREQRTNQLRSMTKKDFQLLRCLYVQDIIFIIFGSMVILYYIYEAITKDQIRTIWEEALVSFLNRIFSLLYNISYSTNFFVYMIISKAFRHELKRIIYKIIGKNLHPIGEEEHRHEMIRSDNAELNVVVSTIQLTA